MKTIYPIVIWPFVRPGSADHIASLFNFLTDIQHQRLSTPTVAIHYCTRMWIADEYLKILKRMEQCNWTIRWVWSVDTCQTWLDAFGRSHLTCRNEGAQDEDMSLQPVAEKPDECTHLLIPGDFHYASPNGQDALAALAHELDHMANPRFRLSLGQIDTRSDSFKELVDEYGTWPLLAHWFPKEATVLRQVTKKPRSEFLAMSGDLLEDTLCQRWLPYTQTLILLLRQVSINAMHDVHLYDLGFLEEDEPVDRYHEGVTQIERIERALRLIWREARGRSAAWALEYEALALGSRQLLKQAFGDLRKRFL